MGTGVKKIGSYHVGVAAEAIAAAQFARMGLDVSVQYGANQPEYDLIVGRGSDLLKVSVKGSQDGKWGLTQKYLVNANYHAAADQWLAAHSSSTVCCLVQLKGASFDEMPRVYLAWPQEIAARLKETSRGRGETILYEDHTWAKNASAAGDREIIPPHWKLTPERMNEILSALQV